LDVRILLPPTAPLQQPHLVFPISGSYHMSHGYGSQISVCAIRRNYSAAISNVTVASDTSEATVRGRTLCSALYRSAAAPWACPRC
jgi:hypothetical protein